MKIIVSEGGKSATLWVQQPGTAAWISAWEWRQENELDDLKIRLRREAIEMLATMPADLAHSVARYWLARLDAGQLEGDGIEK